MTTAQRSWLRWGGLALALSFLAFGLYRRFGPHDADVVAKVLSISGQVSRDERGHENAWQPAQLGDVLSFGDALRTGLDARARVALADGSSLDLQPGTVVRFLANANKQQGRFRVDTGLAMFESTGEGMAIATSTGLVRIDPRSRVRITQDAAGLRMEVSFGRASFLDADQVSRSVLPGDELILRQDKQPTVEHSTGMKPGDQLPGLAPLVAGAAPLEDPYAQPAEQAAPPVEPAKVAQPVERPAPPPRADVTVRAGEYATVHQPTSAPTAVRVRMADLCDGASGTLEVAPAKGGRFRPVGSSEQAVVFAARAGTTRYRVHCNDHPNKVAVAGQLRVIKDAAVRRVPLKPPSNGVDLDGRRYTVLYQNRLPSVLARYTKVPAGTRSRVVVQSGSRMRTYEGDGNSVKIVSGQLEDGEHVIFLESLDGKIKSPKTTLRIAFDNAAPTASFDQRGVLERDASGHAHLSGIVPQGARVSLDGQTLNVDASGRFQADAVLDGGVVAVALRVEHPRAGLHYYVRQVAGESAAQ